MQFSRLWNKLKNKSQQFNEPQNQKPVKIIELAIFVQKKKNTAEMKKSHFLSKTYVFIII